MKINLKILANPYYLFAGVWALCLVFYALRWSTIYPDLSIGLIIFVICAIFLCIPLGRLFQRLSSKFSKTFEIRFKMERLLIFNGFLWLLHFVHSGIPLLDSLMGGVLDHTDSYGVPTLIVFSGSFTGFLGVAIFYHYLRTKEKKYLWYYAINLAPFMLIVSRGTIMMTILSTFFLWLFMEGKQISLKAIAVITVAFLLLLYGFGVAGNYRTMAEMKKYDWYTANGYDNQLILEIAGQSQSFKEGFVPDEFMWGYLYLTSPIGNLQENIDHHKVEINNENTMAYFVHVFSWDFISKRLVEAFQIREYELNLFVPQLAVSTTFAEPYLYLGWPGIIIYLFAMLILPVVYFYFIRYFPLWQVGMAVMCSIYFFSIFDNMFILSGISLQLIYPFLFFKLRKRKILNG